MRVVIPGRLEQARLPREVAGAWAGPVGMLTGAFAIRGPQLDVLHIIASAAVEEIPFEHVSVSLPKRCPVWEEMCFVKDLFWREDECVIQYHPPKSEYVNLHPYTLHLWRPVNIELPLPPRVSI